MSRFVAVVCVVLGLAAGAGAQEKAKSHFVVKVPDHGFKETVLTIGGEDTKQSGGERKFVTPDLDKDGKYTYEFKAVINPNHYTTITRVKNVTFKAGENMTVDLTQKDSVNDKIVVRWVPTPGDIVDEMCKLAKLKKDETVFDLGCGDAVMLIRPIKNFSAKRGVGIDIDAKMIDRAKENAKSAKVEDKLDLKVGDILNVTEKDMADADVVLLYIGDDLGERLGPVLRKALKPGARVVSHRFNLGDWAPTQTIEKRGEDGDNYVLHLWTIPEKK